MRLKKRQRGSVRRFGSFTDDSVRKAMINLLGFVLAASFHCASMPCVGEMTLAAQVKQETNLTVVQRELSEDVYYVRILRTVSGVLDGGAVSREYLVIASGQITVDAVGPLVVLGADLAVPWPGVRRAMRIAKWWRRIGGVALAQVEVR